jgi:MoxR-like ATPase
VALPTPNVTAAVEKMSKLRVGRYKPNATYPKAPRAKDLESNYASWLGFAFKSGLSTSYDGSPGLGKTAEAEAEVALLAEALGVPVELVVINVAQIDPTALVLPAKVEDESRDFPFLDFTLDSQLADEETLKVILLDDKSRAAKPVQNMLLELVQSRSIQGKRIPNVLAVLGTDNLGKAEGVTSQPDWAAKDRWVTFKVTDADTSWRYALAAKYSDIDLSGVFSYYNSLPHDIRWFFSPRKLDHLLFDLINGLPGVWAVSLIGGERRWWGSEDKTFEIIDAIARAIGVTNRTTMEDPLRVVVDLVDRFGVNANVESEPGTGKTAYLSQLINELEDTDLIALSGPTLMPDDFVFSTVVNGTVTRIPNGRFVKDPERKKMLVLDEGWRSTAATRNGFMPLLQEKRLGGIKLENFSGVIMANNPKRVAGMTLDVGRPDPAQADRFGINIQLKPNDIPSLSYLLDKYGDDAKPVVDWYREDLPPTDPSRVLVTRRTLERIIVLAQHDMDIESAFITDEDGNRYPPIPLTDLRARLADRPMAKLSAIAASVEEWEARLTATPVDPEDLLVVFAAFSDAMEEQLTEHRDACVRLYRLLDEQSRFNLLRHGGSRQTFWRGVLADSQKAA